MIAEPEDLQIVCRVHNVGPVPESETEDEEIVVSVTSFANHPDFEVGGEGSRSFTDGSYKGSDISVYHVDDKNLRLEEGKLWPACLPRFNLDDLDQAFFAHLDPGCAIFVRDFFRWSVFGIMTKLMGSPKTHGVTDHVGIREF